MGLVVGLRSVVLSILGVCLFAVLAGSQATPFDELGGVSVTDQTPTIASDTEKRYTTTIRLEKISQGVEFVPNSFANAAEGFYSIALSGYIQVENVQSSTVSSNTIQVTYDVRYSYEVLLGSVGGDDDIESAIGNVNSVRNGLNSIQNILSLYSVLDDEESFSFVGSSLCASATCNGTYVTCIENTNGISPTCVSDCKNGYCGDDGICFHTDPNVVPVCRCTSLPDLWIIGARCETKFPLWLVVLLSVIGFIILLIVIAIVIFCVMRKRKEKKRKQELLNSMPKSYHNQAFANDQIRTTTIVPRTNVLPQAKLGSTLTRDDSFETVTSSELPPSEYRPRNHTDRRSHAGSTHSSRDHHRNEYRHHRHRHRGHHRRRSSDEPRRRSENRHSRGSSPEASKKQAQPPESESSSTETDEKGLENLSFYEVEVNDLDLETEAESDVVAASSTKSSPIRWLPPKNDQPRPGWVPSLGPMMYDLPTSKKTYTTESLPRRREGGTDV